MIATPFASATLIVIGAPLAASVCVLASYTSISFDVGLLLIVTASVIPGAARAAIRTAHRGRQHADQTIYHRQT